MKNQKLTKEELLELISSVLYYMTAIDLYDEQDREESLDYLEEELKDLGFDEEDVQDICERIAQNRV